MGLTTVQRYCAACDILHSHTAFNEQVTHWCGNLWLGSLVVRELDLLLTVMCSNPCNMAIFRFYKMAAVFPSQSGIVSKRLNVESRK